MRKFLRLVMVFVALALIVALPVTAVAEASASPRPTASPDPQLRPEENLRVNQKCIDWCGERGLLDTGSGFDAAAPASRAMVAGAFFRLDGRADAFPTEMLQAVLDGVGYGRAVSIGGEAAGRPDESFSLDRDITRQELASVLYQRAGSPEDWNAAWPANVEDLEDWDDVSAYARQAAQWAMDVELVPNYYYSDGEYHSYFLPQGTVTCSELAEVVYKLYLLNPRPYKLDLAEVAFINVRGEKSEDRFRLEDTEEIERFITLLNGVEVRAARPWPATIGCAHKGFSIFFKRDILVSPAQAEVNALSFDQEDYGTLTFWAQEVWDFEAMYTLAIPDPFPEDEFAALIYGLPEEAGSAG